MDYTFKYQTKALDLWQLTMYGVYNSFLGPINIIFIIAMILLLFKYFTLVNVFLKIVLIIGVLMFILIQPLLIYYNSWKKVQLLPKAIELGMDDRGLHINSDDKKADIKWEKVKGIRTKPTLLVIVVTDQHGYVLSNRVLKSKKNEVFDYMTSKLKESNNK